MKRDDGEKKLLEIGKKKLALSSTSKSGCATAIGKRTAVSCERPENGVPVQKMGDVCGKKEYLQTGVGLQPPAKAFS